MLTHYLSTALRNFRHHKLTTAINLICLAIGIACFMAMHGVVAFFGRSDRHLENYDRIYAITQKTAVPGSDFIIPTLPYASWRVGPVLKTEFPELETVARAVLGGGPLGGDAPVAAGDRKQFLQFAYADPELFEIFPFKFLAGDTQRALRGSRSVVLTEDAAVRLYGSAERAMGALLTMNNSVQLTVTGVVAPIQQPSHMGTAPGTPLRFEMLISMDALEVAASYNVVARGVVERWNAPSTLTYVVLPRDGSLDTEALRSGLQGFSERHVPAEMARVDLGLMPLGDIYLSRIDALLRTDQTGLSAVTLLYVLGGMILLISCLNYANLANAQAASRAKEVGMRRVVGANRRQILLQYLLEAALMSLSALATVGALTLLALVPLRSSGIASVFGVILAAPGFWAGLLAMLLAVIVVAGAYPALVLSRVRPVQALRTGRMKTPGRFVSTVMVGTQFAAASFLLTVILVMSAQNKALKQQALGSTSDPVVTISNNIAAAGIGFDTLRDELLRQPHVKTVTATLFEPWSFSSCLQEIVSASADRAAKRWEVCGSNVQHDFFSTFDLNVLAGRVFARDRGDDNANAKSGVVQNVVIDRILAEEYGWQAPQEAIGQTIYVTRFANPAEPSSTCASLAWSNRVRWQRSAWALGPRCTCWLLLATIPSIRVSRADIRPRCARSNPCGASSRRRSR